MSRCPNLSARIFPCLVMVAVAGCSDHDVGEAPSVFSESTTFRATVRASADNTLAVPTALPRATCSLRLQGTEEVPGQSLDLHSDAAGRVSFHFVPRAAGVVAREVLDCVDAHGATASSSIELRSAADAPALVAPAPSGLVRPPLAETSLELPIAELVARGYPPRPDASSSPQAYQSWLELVSRPSTRVPVTLIENQHHADTATPNWAGYAVQGHRPYVLTTGNWTIPSVSGEFGNGSLQTDYSSLWVGVGGYNTNGGDLWQGGTEQDVSCQQLLGCHVSLFPWVELPAIQSQIEFFGFDLAAGHQFTASVWVGDVAGNPTINGAYAWWYIDNATLQISSLGNQPIPSSVHMNGGSAEWIVERTLVTGGLPHLANFGSAQISNAQALDSRGTWRFYGNDRPIQLGMYNSSNNNKKLASASQANASTLTLTWLAFF